MALVFGFGGVTPSTATWPSTPTCRATSTSLAFLLRVHDRQIRLTLTHESERYVLDEGDPLDVTIRDAPSALGRRAPHARPAPLPEAPVAEAPGG